MKILRKIDDSYRVLIPQEIRQVLNLTKHQEVELTVDEDNNRIILTPIEKRPINDENEIQPVQKLEQKLSFDYRNTPPIIYYSNKDKDLNSDEDVHIKPVTEIYEEPTKIDKFKPEDVLQFFTPTPIGDLNDEDLTNLEFCPKCDKVVEPTSYVKVNGKRLCMSCIQDLKDQLKQDIKNK